VQVHDDAIGAVDMTGVCVDSTIVRAHQHAAGARKKGNQRGRAGSKITKRTGRSGGPAAD
jgi:hypothetical protein